MQQDSILTAALLLDLYGWFTLNGIALVLIAVAVLSVGWLKLQQRAVPVRA